MAEATQKRLYTKIAILLLLTVVVAATALCFVRRDSQLQVRWDFRNWQFGPYERRDTMGVTPVSGIVLTALTRNYTTVTKGHYLGPMNVFRVWGENGPAPVGTNSLLVGDRLFDPVTMRELWKVLGVERDHEFEDGTEREGVRVRDLVNNGEAWVPRTNLSKAMVTHAATALNGRK
jgi:hypothetical protein